MRLFGIVVLSTLLLAASCSDVKSPSDNNFDRAAMLTAVADNNIIPSLETLSTALADLQVRTSVLFTSPTPQAVAESRTAWLSVAMAWQDVVMFDFGPAEGLFGNLADNAATFPADASEVESRVASLDTSHSDFQRGTRGIYAVEYLLFNGTDEEVSASFVSGNNNRSQYLTSVVNKLIGEVNNVLNEWKTSYRARFIASSGTDVGSGTSLLFNNLARQYELLKNYKVALPLGKVAGQTTTEPTKVEAYYSGNSIMLMKLHFAAAMRIWRGVGNAGQQQPGFRAYLATVPGGTELIAETEAQEALVLAQLQSYDNAERFSSIISTNPARVEPLQIETQKMTRFLKSELASALGLAITFSSGDGD